MMQKDIFLRCLTSRKNKSQQLDQVLQNPEIQAEIEELARECTRRTINTNSFVLRGDLAVPPAEELYTAICGLVEHVVDDVAAESIIRVRYLRRRDTNLVQVQCDSSDQCQRITSRRKAFSRVDPTPHQSAAVQRLLRTKLYVDNYCTKDQLRIRHSKWKLFRQLQAKGLHPFFDGEQLYHYPVGSKDPILYTEQPAAISEEQLQAPQQQQPLRQQQQQQLPQRNQQQQPQQGQAALPSATSTPIAEPSTSAAATTAAQSVLQPTTRGNAPSIQQPAKAPLAWKKQKLPADDPVFKDKIWLRTYKNNSRMKRAKISIVDLHAEQQARQRQGDGSYSGQKVTCTAENTRGSLPDIVVADELVSWYVSCLRRSYSKAVQQVTTRPADATRWR
jgi:hypothetical protein